ncbi:putative galacturonosyltransferase 13 [Zea mays]|uniref:Hexosyltransferase n=1 Tax=Zea mays TaxID=4577 RepID=A0A1D6MWM3_MAIZE|nr:putative galacturonosyltransferase 13 [Zea mays]
MQIRLSPSMRSITISTSHGLLDLMRLKVAARHFSYRTVFHTVLILAFLLPFVFILTAIMTLEGFNKCSSLDCLGRRLGPRLLGRGNDGSMRLVRDLYVMLDKVNSEEAPLDLKVPETFDEFIWDMKNNDYDLRSFAFKLKATNLKSNFTLWRLGTLPPGLIAFKGHVHPIDPSWHLLGLGYQEKTDISSVEQAAVIHYNGQSKPWLEIGFKHLQPFWTKYVNYSNEFLRNCHIMEPQL